MATIRNPQLDGWRAFAVLGVMWLHWAPSEWRGPFPFEIGLFFFLTLTGFLITRILLRERAAGEVTSQPWRVKAYTHFQKRRMVRILVPCYAAMVFALIVGAPDLRNHPLLYFFHLSNFHMAVLEKWPSGTAHYWTLALQVQFYLLWPIIVFWTPRRGLKIIFLLCVAVAPLSRMVIPILYPQIHHHGVLPFVSCDYFAVGALLALALERGMRVGDGSLKWASWLAFLGYVILYIYHERGETIAGFWCIQQTLVSVVFIGLISATLAGFSGVLGRVLEHPSVQAIGRLSFGLYLFHTPVPLLLGHIFPFLWHPSIVGPWIIVRLLAFALTSWGLAFVCWKYLESHGTLASHPLK